MRKALQVLLISMFVLQSFSTGGGCSLPCCTPDAGVVPESAVANTSHAAAHGHRHAMDAMGGMLLEQAGSAQDKDEVHPEACVQPAAVALPALLRASQQAPSTSAFATTSESFLAFKPAADPAAFFRLKAPQLSPSPPLRI